MSNVPRERAAVMEEGRGGGAPWWAALGHVRGLGAATMLRLARVFGSPQAAVQASQEALTTRGGLTPEQAEQVVAQADSWEEFVARLEGYARRGIKLIAMDDPHYPVALLALRSPPPLLYVRGELLPQDERAVAIVGTRTPSPEGARLAHSLACAFAARGFTIVSGLARGIDTAGHRGALEVEQGRTVAALGCGLLRIYPTENLGLARKVSERGALVAEVSPETPVDRRWLLARDRIQAGLSRAVIVVQAHQRCGSLVAARYARQCGRPVFGAPWTEPPYSEGWAELQKMGARSITQESDLDALVNDLEVPPPAGAEQPTLL